MTTSEQGSPQGIIPLAIPFRGNRDYLHSTTFFDALVALTGPDAGQPLSLNIYKTITEPVGAAPFDGNRAAVHGVFAYTDGAGNKQSLGLYPLPGGGPAPGRVPCNENAIIAAATVGEAEAEATAGPIGTLVETIVALNKTLVGTRMAGRLKPMFSTLELTRLPTVPVSVRLRIDKQLGIKLFVSTVTVDDTPVGRITFIGA